MSNPADGAMAARTDATRNTTSALRNAFLRPQRTPSLPASSNSAANVTL
jgi:hypothetical protein